MVYSSQSILHPMDGINQRYSRKRALYLAGLAQHLSTSPLVGPLHYSCLHGNRLRPLLLVAPSGRIVPLHSLEICRPVVISESTANLFII